MLEFAQRQGESHGRPVVFLYPSSIAAYGLPSLDAKRAGRQSEGRSVQLADDDVRLQQALLASCLAIYYASHYKQLSADPLTGKVDFRGDSLPGTYLGRDLAVGRNLRLRSGDDPRGRGATSLTHVSFGPIRGSPSWRCRMRSRRW